MSERICTVCGSQHGGPGYKYCSPECRSAVVRARGRAKARRREQMRYTSDSDVTPEQETGMRRKARKCPMPGCGVRMTDKPHLPNSKELDHIVPRNQGGTHTHGNVRIICRQCNQKRPKDGSDYFGPVTLWAQGEVPISRPDGRRTRAVSRKTCRKGLHPWVPENIVMNDKGKRRCRLCRDASHNCGPLKQCRCGAMFPAPGSTHMCPACVKAAAQRAAELHAGGMSWEEIAPMVGYNSGVGIAYAAKRIGYEAAPRPATPKTKAERLCPDCGMPKAAGQRECQPCATARAWQAAELRARGMRLRDIADQLGYTSVTTVTNLLKTVVTVVPYSRGIMLSDDYRETSVNA